MSECTLILCNDRLINTGLYIGDILGERKKLIAQCAGIVQICLYMNSVICERYCQNACTEVQKETECFDYFIAFLYKKIIVETVCDVFYISV